MNPPVEIVSSDLFCSDLGWMAVAWTPRGVRGVTFGHESAEAVREWWLRRFGKPYPPTSVRSELRQRLQAYAAGEPIDFRNESVDLNDRTDFQRRMLRACHQIPYGAVSTYGELAQRVGVPRAARAVGQVMAHNSVPLIVPCHRVIGAAGRLGGFSAPANLLKKRTIPNRPASNPERARVARCFRPFFHGRLAGRRRSVTC